ncbi:MAG: FHA domain-containing protein, partial [Psychrosphaera sp.]|nr:FHA domain-containing protein [Psychrosphaera sp.]
LPDEQTPEVVVFIDPTEQQWCIEHLGEHFNQEEQHNVTLLNEHDIVEFDGQKWQLRLSHLATPTEQFEPLRHQLDQLNFVFDLSFDEEVTQLRLITPEDTIEFYARSHHYLTLNLARYRACDAQNGIEPQKQGWVYPEQLMKDLGLDVSHLNIQIHRARKQFTDVLHGLCDAQSLIVRQAGKLRFGGSLFSIYKGQQLECESKGRSNI